MNRGIIEIAINRGPEVIFNIPRSLDILRVRGAALEFREDCLIRLHHDVGQNIEPATMRHAQHDLLNPNLGGTFDHGVEQGDQGLGAFNTKTLGTGVFGLQELLEFLGRDQLLENAALALVGEARPKIIPFHPNLDP